MTVALAFGAAAAGADDVAIRASRVHRKARRACRTIVVKSVLATIPSFEADASTKGDAASERDSCVGRAGQVGSRSISVAVMTGTALNVREILAGRAASDTPVIVRGWVRTRRDSKAGISFVHLSDGSSFYPLQVVAPNTLPNYADEVLKLTAGCAIEATGTIVPSPAKGQPFEMQGTAIRV